MPDNPTLAKTLDLPGHWTSHSQYTAAVRPELDKLNKMFLSGRLSDTQLALGMGNIQRLAREGLENGKFAVDAVTGGLK